MLPSPRDREARDRARARVRGVREPAVRRDDEPARCGLMRHDRSADRVRARGVDRVRRRRACCLGDERAAEAVELEAEGRAARRRARDARLRVPVRADLEGVERARGLLGHDELRAVRREGDLRRSRAEERLRRAGEQLDAALAVDLVAGDRSCAARVEDVQQVLVDGEARRERAVRRERRQQLQVRRRAPRTRRSSRCRRSRRRAACRRRRARRRPANRGSRPCRCRRWRRSQRA